MPNFEANFDNPEVAMLRSEIVEISANNAYRASIRQSDDYEGSAEVSFSGILRIDNDSWNVNLRDIIQTETGPVTTIEVGSGVYELSGRGITDFNEDKYLSEEEIMHVRYWLRETKWTPAFLPFQAIAEPEE